jgi:hypothetical protein
VADPADHAVGIDRHLGQPPARGGAAERRSCEQQAGPLIDLAFGADQLAGQHHVAVFLNGGSEDFVLLRVLVVKEDVEHDHPRAFAGQLVHELRVQPPVPGLGKRLAEVRVRGLVEINHHHLTRRHLLAEAERQVVARPPHALRRLQEQPT